MTIMMMMTMVMIILLLFYVSGSGNKNTNVTNIQRSVWNEWKKKQRNENKTSKCHGKQQQSKEHIKWKNKKIIYTNFTVWVKNSFAWYIFFCIFARLQECLYMQQIFNASLVFVGFFFGQNCATNKKEKIPKCLNEF